ncbi:MAG: BatD family protein [Opitutaceae bacterium]|nr:BatD family protein [Opitutaceae bacterium]
MRILTTHLRLVVAVIAVIFGSATATVAQTVRWDPPGGQLGFNQVSELALVFENCEPDSLPRLPPVDGLAFLGQPSQSSQTEIVNFNITRRFSYVYSVRPSKRTNINIPAFEVQTDKGKVSVPAAAYTVGQATVGSTGLAIDDVAKARLTTPETTYWAGEVFPVTFTLDVVRRHFNALATTVDWPSTPLLTEDWSKPDLGEIRIGNENHVIAKQTTRAIAREPGALNLSPASQLINLVVGMTGFGFFSQPSIEQRLIASAPLELTIKPLPPAPADFAKAVGQFSLVSKIVPTTAAVGEPVTWTLELSGTGNWPDIAGLPARDVSSDFQVVQPKSKRTMKDNALFEGTLSEDVVLVPTRPGTYRLGPVRYTYFDAQSGAYKTLTTDVVTVTVTGAGLPASAPQSAAGPIQFSLTPPASTLAPAPALPTPVPPAPPEKLPRDPLAGPQSGFIPWRSPGLAWLGAAAFALPVLAVWLGLATRRSRATDPQRRRREACAELAAVLAEMRDGGGIKPGLLRRWQQHAAILWEIGHAAPAPRLLHACVARLNQDGASTWATLWEESDRALHGPPAPLPPDWLRRAEGALQAVRVPGWPLLSLFAPRNLLPFLTLIAVVLAVPVAGSADDADAAYRRGDFAAAEKGWRETVTAAPSDWVARHNLGLTLAQQDRWGEAAAHWTSAFLLNPRAEATRWDLALGLQYSGFAPPELVEFSRGEGRYALARLASPGEWQLMVVVASLLLAAAAILWLLRGYRLGKTWTRPASIATCVLALLLFVAATFSLKTYGALARPDAVLVWKQSVLRSIPTEADTSQKTSPLSPGSIALTDKTFLGWSRLVFSGGQTGWVRSGELVPLYR